jgi:hypothetical protein
VVCPTHGEFKQGLNAHLSGHGCPECGTASRVEKARWTLAEVEATCTEEKLLGVTSKVVAGRNRSEVVALCPDHGPYTKPVDKLLAGQRCPVCAINLRGERACKSLEEYAIEATKVHQGAYTYISLDRTGSYPKVVAVCPTHGEFKQGMAGHLQGGRCPACANVKSLVANEFVEYIKELAPETVVEGGLPGCRYRWDALVPSKRLAFEFHGLYWHSTEHKPPPYHSDKHKAGLAAGYRTIHIFEDEWSERGEIVKRLLRHLLQSTPSRVWAKHCVAGACSTAGDFLDKWHIQGGVAGITTRS